MDEKETNNYVHFAVILDTNGFSKGYGFVRFADEDEQKDALLQMNGFKV